MKVMNDGREAKVKRRKLTKLSPKYFSSDNSIISSNSKSVPKKRKIEEKAGG